MKHNNQNATAIMCAYNEKQTIGGILETLLKCTELKEIIVSRSLKTEFK